MNDASVIQLFLLDRQITGRLVTSMFLKNLYANDVTLDDDPDDDIPLIHLQKKIPCESLDEITDIENTIPTEETYDEDWEQTMLDNIKDKENLCGV
jgi:hypothetical protein